MSSQEAGYANDPLRLAIINYLNSNPNSTLEQIFRGIPASHTKVRHWLQELTRSGTITPDNPIGTIPLSQIQWSPGGVVTMPLQFKVGNFTAPAATGNQSVTGLGFQPKGLILSSNAGASYDTQIASSFKQFGASDGTTHKSIHSTDLDAQSVSDSYRSHGTNAIFKSINRLFELRNVATVASFDPDGFTLNWSIANFAGPVAYIAWGGDIEVKVGQFNEPASTGIQSINTGIDTADFAMIFSNLSLNDVVASHYVMGYGFSDGTNDGCIYNTTEHNVTTTNTKRKLSKTNIIDYHILTTGVDARIAKLNAFTPTGFDLNWTNTSGNTGIVYNYITIKGVNVQVGNGTQRTTVGTKAYPTAFKPKGLLMFSHGTTVTGVPSAVLADIFGATDGTNQESIQCISLNNAATSDSKRKSINDGCFVHAATSGLEVAVAELVSFNDTGFTLNWSASNGAAREIIWAVFS